MDIAQLRIIEYSGYPFFIQQTTHTSTNKKQILQRVFFSPGKGNSMFLTLRQGQALRVCEKIILAQAPVFFRQNLAVAKHGLFRQPERKESLALQKPGNVEF